jgi:hypothetical protein
LRETAVIAFSVLAVFAIVARCLSASLAFSRAARAALLASKLATRASTASLLTVLPSESIVIPV